jgi:hypothetical protein
MRYNWDKEKQKLSGVTGKLRNRRGDVRRETYSFLNGV